MAILTLLLLTAVSLVLPEMLDLAGFGYPFAQKNYLTRGYNWLVNALTDPKRFMQFSFLVLILGVWIIWWRKK